jgi:hypothetical protein
MLLEMSEGSTLVFMDDPEFFECKLMTVPPGKALRAISELSRCEACNDGAEIPFDWILAEVMNRPGMFEFVLAESVRCPLCHAPVSEKTLVDRGGIEVS